MPLEVKIALITLLGVIITGACSIIATTIQSRKQQSELLSQMQHQSELQDVRIDAKVEKISAVTDTKIEELTREVRAHNNFAERIPAIEADIRNLKTAIGGK